MTSDATITHLPKFRTTLSTGPAVVGIGDADGVAEGTPCFGCQLLVQKGEPITKYRHGWWHELCARRDAEAGDPDEAWLALGYDLARSPRSYGVREARAIVGRLLNIVEEHRAADRQRAADLLVERFPVLDRFGQPEDVLHWGQQLTTLEDRTIAGDRAADAALHELMVTIDALPDL